MGVAEIVDCKMPVIRPCSGMAGRLQTVKATVEPDGTVRLLQPIQLDGTVEAVLTFVVEDSRQPNAETIAAIEEGREGLERFASVDALFAELDG